MLKLDRHITILIDDDPGPPSFITFRLTPEQGEKLVRRAARTGKSVTECACRIVLQAIRDE